MPPGSLLRRARPLMMGRGASALVGFALPVVLARTLDQGSYGTYKQLFLLAFLAMHSLQLGLSQALFYFVPRAGSPEKQRAYLGQTQVMLGTIGAIAALVIFQLVPLLSHRFQNPQLEAIALPLSLLSGFLIASSTLEIGLTARGKPGFSALALVASDLLRVSLMLLPVLAGWGIVGLAWGAALASGLRWLLSLHLVVGPGWLSFSRESLKQQLAYSLPFGFAVLLAMPQQQFHQLLVASKATPELFALYAVGCMQIPVVSLLYMPVSESLQVQLAELERSGRTHESGPVFAEAVDRLAMFFLPMSALLIAVSRPLLELLYGEDYGAAAPIFRIAVLSVVVSSLPVEGVLKARARTKTLLAANAVKLSVTWPLLSGFYALFGMKGVIAGHILLEASTKLGLLGVVARELNSPLLQLLAPRSLARSLALSGIACLAGWNMSAMGSSAFSACIWGGGTAGLVLGVPLMGRWMRRGELRL